MNSKYRLDLLYDYVWIINIFIGASIANIGYLYVGCYRDESFPRRLSDFMADYPESLTPQHCVTICKQKEFQFAGVQAGYDMTIISYNLALDLTSFR